MILDRSFGGSLISYYLINTLGIFVRVNMNVTSEDCDIVFLQFKCSIRLIFVVMIHLLLIFLRVDKNYY